jgi:hypothetical protein
VHIHIPAQFAFDNGRVYSRDGFTLEAILNERSGHNWVLSREPGITTPLRRAVRKSGWGLPTVVPEIALYFKAQDLRRRDERDFLALFPQLTGRQLDWLRDAVAAVRHDHPWLAQLAR